LIAVGGDQEIALGRGATGEVRDHAFALPLDALQRHPRAVMRVGHDFAERKIDARPGARGILPRMRMYDAAGRVEPHIPGHLDRHRRVEARAGAAHRLGELARRTQPRAAGGQHLLRSLEDGRGPADLAEQAGRVNGRPSRATQGHPLRASAGR
jgi:hypothetical protein